MPFIVRNSSAINPFLLQDAYLDLILDISEHVDLEQVFPEDQLYMSSVSPGALYTAIQNGDIVRRTDADDADIAAGNAFDDAIWRWSPSRQQKEALVGQPLTPNSTNKYLTQGVFTIKVKAGGTPRYGNLVFLEGSNISLTDDGAGNFTFASTFSTTYGSPVTQAPDSGNIDGSASSAAHSDHKHNIPTAIAVSVGTANAQGASTTDFSKADHVHRGISSLKAKATGTARYGDIVFLEGTNITITDDGAGNFTFASTFATSYGSPVALSPDSGNIDGVATTATRSDHKHDVPCAAPTTTLSPATTNAEGTGSSFTRNDHTHAVSTALVGVITTIQPDATASAGTQDSYTRGDHRHAIDAAAPSTSLSATTSNAEGSATSFSRSDHSHAILTGTPSTQNPDQANATGSSANLARADHIHNIPCDTPVAIGSTNTEGTSTSFARADHIHSILGYVKAGVVASGSFSGNPKKATVSFTTAFGSTNYAISIVGIDARTWTYESKAVGGFVINANANAALSGEVSWTAILTGS